MKVYFVRHGESQANAKGVFQDPSVPLSSIGLQQADSLSRFFTPDRPIDLILSSPYLRAAQTATAISRHISLPVNYTKLLVELSNPSQIVGHRYQEPKAHEIKMQIALHSADPTWHYSDEENHYQLMQRAQRGVDYLESLKARNVVAVTHGAILKMMISVMTFGNDLTLDIFGSFDDLMEAYNSAVAICQHNPKTGWRLLSWNDYSHLGNQAVLKDTSGLAT